MLKVAAIGGGSSYTPELVEGLILRQKELPVSELWLVDIPAGEHKLKIIADLARRMVAKAGVNMAIHAGLDRAAALTDADFVISQFRVGQVEARILDETIPARHGLIGQETNGAGGMFNGLRTIPQVFAIIDDCKRLCPQAWLINFTNPAGMITEAVFRYSDWQRFIGLCNVPIGIEMALARMLGIDKQRLRIDFAGLNHMVFGLEIYIDGVPSKEKFLAQLGEESFALSMKNIEAIPWSKELLHGLGAIPCPYHRYYFQKEEMLASSLADYRRGVTRGQAVKAIEEQLFAKYADPALAVKPPELEQRGGAFYSDAACNLMASIYNDSGDIQPVNTVNNGAIADLPADVAVEVSCRIGKEGPRPLVMGSLPAACRGIVQQIKSFELAACQAAVSGKYEDALAAMVINPLVQSEKLGRAVLDELLLAHAEHLPQFADAIATVKQRCG